MIKKIVVVSILLNISGRSFGQDIQFSQYYAAPIYLNPAFTGITEHHRVISNYRVQWPALPRAFSTYAFSYDFNPPRFKSNFGLLFYTDRAGTANLRTQNIAATYAYTISLKNWVIQPGLQFGYGSRNIDYNNLLYSDQLGAGNVDPNDATFRQILDNGGRVDYFDFGAGILIYNRKYWFGLSAHHINQPSNSFTGESTILPMKISAQVGARFTVMTGGMRNRKESYFVPSLIYRNQSLFDQLDFGFQYIYPPVMFGIWYRGIPFQEQIDYFNHDGIVFMLGLNLEIFEVGYSYDFTVSRLSNVGAGAHELSIIYQFKTERLKRYTRKDKSIPCPALQKTLITEEFL